MASTQEYPAKTVRLVVPSGPGNPQDIVARTLAQELTRLIGQPVVIENKPGAGQLVGYEYVARQAPADGYTLAIGLLETMAMPLSTKDIQIDLLKELVPIISIGSGRLLLAIPSTQPWRSFNDLVSNAKASPGKLNYGYMSQSSSFLLEIILRDLGLNVVAIPFGGNSGAYAQAMTQGSVQMTIVSESTFKSFGDKVRAVATTGEQRNPAMPDVPTLGELGFPQIVGFSFALFAPAATPRAVIDKINSATARSLQQPALRATFAKMGLDPARDTAPAAVSKSLSDLSRMFVQIAGKMASPAK